MIAPAPLHRAPARPARSRRWLAVGLALPLLLLLWSLETAPGLHGDEAWVALATHDVAYRGARPIDGMNGYTGALPLYVLAAAVRLFGPRLLVLRAVSALLNVLFAAAFAAVARALTRDARGWPWAAVLVASSPMLLLESRFTTELTAFVPAMLMGGLASCLRAVTGQRGWRLAQAALGGVLMGLACHTHAAAAIFVTAAAVGAIGAYRAQALRHPAGWAAAGGLVLGLAPRLARLPAALASARVLADSVRPAGSVAADLSSLLPVLAGVLDGGLLYRRFTGQELWTVLPYATLALAGVAALRALAVRGPLDRSEQALLWGALTSLALTALCAPQLSLRYFMFTAWIVQLWLFVTVLRVRARASPRAGRVAVGLLASVIALNLAYVLVDFHVAFARTGGRPALFPLGTRLVETSNHFLRTDRLYRQLADRGVRGVLAEDFIAVTLTFYEQLEQRGLALGALPVQVLPGDDAPFRPDAGFALVYYAGLDGPSAPPAFDYVHADAVLVGELLFRRDPSYDANFRVFLSPAARARADLLPR